MHPSGAGAKNAGVLLLDVSGRARLAQQPLVALHTAACAAVGSAARLASVRGCAVVGEASIDDRATSVQRCPMLVDPMILSGVDGGCLWWASGSKASVVFLKSERLPCRSKILRSQ